jgi:hypothetical protein
MSRRNPTVTSPKGTAIWPKLNEPDRKFQPEGVYSTRLRMSEADAKPFIETLTQLYDELFAEETSARGGKKPKKAQLPWAPATDYDKETESRVEVPGMVDFKFTMKATVNTKSGKSWEQRPALFDAQVKPLPADAPPIGGGSTLRIAAEVYSWNAPSLGFGITLRPRSVQILDLKTYEVDNSSGFMPEDGYVAETPVSADADF